MSAGGPSAFRRDWGGLFDPAAVAVVGASNFPGKWGFNMPLFLLGGGYRGKLFMVNPKEKRVLGIPAFPSLCHLEERVDLAIVAIPARSVLRVVEDAAAAGIRNLIVVSSDFSETGAEGAALERELASAANASGITVVGPNTMGVFSVSSRLCALGAPVFPRPGGVSFISQSGNLGVQVLNAGCRRGIGFARFIGSGNAANTGIPDYLDFLASDPLTRVILIYAEGMGDGRRFLESAERASRVKPVIALKAGRGELGRRAASSHSGSMAGNIELFRAACRQAGVIEADSSEELMELAAAFSSLPLPRGPRAAVLTLGGGWGVVAADACDRENLRLAALPDSLVAELDSLLPRFWSRRNPVDIVGNVRRSNHYRIIRALLECPEVDLLISMGTLLGRGFFLDNLLNTALRPFFHMLRNRPLRVAPFLAGMAGGALDSLRRRGAFNPEGSGGLDLKETFAWADSSMAGYLERLMRETGKPIINVAVNEREGAASSALRRLRLFTAASPEKAVRVAACLADYASRYGPGKPQ
jgi:acyl-CoA synthetase (NDP forming)